MAPAFSIISAVIAALSVTVAAVPVAEPETVQILPRTNGEAHFVRNWDEGGRKRYEYNFKGATCDQFNLAIINHGGIPGAAGMNFQCGWAGPSGFTQFDVSVVEGAAGAAIVSDGIRDVTGQDCNTSGFCP